MPLFVRLSLTIPSSTSSVAPPFPNAGEIDRIAIAKEYVCFSSRP